MLPLRHCECIAHSLSVPIPVPDPRQALPVREIKLILANKAMQQSNCQSFVLRTYIHICTYILNPASGWRVGKKGKLGAEPLSLDGMPRSMTGSMINPNRGNMAHGMQDAEAALNPLIGELVVYGSFWEKNLLNCHPFRLSCPLLGCNIVQLCFTWCVDIETLQVCSLTSCRVELSSQCPRLS
jgi:hypothetical protein